MTKEDKLEIEVLCGILSTEIDPESDSYGSIKQSFKDGMVAMMLGICFLFGHCWRFRMVIIAIFSLMRRVFSQSVNQLDSGS